ncbi:carbohydrate-binding protein [Paraflavitalea sp. CAU 1676]|uniref:carbohydrate-binding protein n=1 Tax=Paraflavitalea sp. CAU 1676 TaxID=3032598 RepID=UPI0023DB530D|nr:carbohydrate-binding protein [Paraflavitalea sp. CAU 1676]MDF2192119.1 carbohydrate-binding protein [Paraflavitalea sp. CAU 1676]
MLNLSASAQLSRLRADGQRIVNASNQEVMLKGVGLGAWLLQEGYMMNPNSGGTQWSFKRTLYNQGQTDAQVEAFYQSWRDNFITQADINWIADQGFNCVRIPMHYELFLTAAQRAVRNTVARNSSNYTNYVNSITSWYNNNQLFTDVNTEGFRTLENCLNWCAARGMYVIVDLHAAPGAQGTDANISDALVANDLWNRTIFQDVTVRLWQAIVTRHINNNTVAFWDLINEPNNVPGGGQAIFSLTNRLVNMVRGLGDTHLIMIEGNGWGNNYDWLEPNKFTNQSNLVYNAHRYWIPEADDNVRDGNPNQINRMINLTEFRTRWNVPVWVGETGENSDAWLRQNVDKLNAAGIGWCHWTYKRTSSSPNAALRRIVGPPYLTDGVSAMSGVLNNIPFANTVVNSGPLAAVDPRRGSSTTCTGTYNAVPATIQAEAYCAMSGIQTEACTDAGGGQDVGYIDAGDWLGYRINVPTAGSYTIQYRIASQSGGGNIRLERFGGGTVFGTLAVPSTGGWQTWQTISHTVTLPAGQQEIGLAAVAGGFNLNWISITSNTPVGAPIGQIITLRGINNQFVSGENGTQAMRCNRATAGDWERFSVLDGGNGTVVLRSMGKYVSSENGAAAITCSRTVVGGWERFTWVTNADGTISLRGSNNLYVSSENGTTAMTCNRTAISGWEAFNWASVGTVANADINIVTAIASPDAATARLRLQVYPNPSPGAVNIKTTLPGKVVIFDVAGRTVYQGTIRKTLTIYSLKQGVYTVRVAGDQQWVESKKLVIRN